MWQLKNNYSMMARNLYATFYCCEGNGGVVIRWFRVNITSFGHLSQSNPMLFEVLVVDDITHSVEKSNARVYSAVRLRLGLLKHIHSIWMKWTSIRSKNLLSVHSSKTSISAHSTSTLSTASLVDMCVRRSSRVIVWTHVLFSISLKSPRQDELLTKLMKYNG